MTTGYSFDALVEKMGDLVQKEDMGKYAAPLPDFHLPLNDNIMIREGVGTPYTDGIPIYHADFTRATSKTYISKSGVLTTAAIDEPAFEKEGILIEGESTNLLSESTALRSPSASTVSLTNNELLGIKSSKVVTGSNVFTGSGRVAIAPSTVYSGSFYIDLENVSLTLGAIRFQFAYAENWLNKYIVVDIDTGEILYNTTGYPAKIRIFGSLMIANITTQSTATPDTNGGALDIYNADKNDPAGTSVTEIGDYVGVYSFQLEQLPSASSYIPTEGSPVTRAADRPYTITSGALGDASESNTIFARCKINPVNEYPRFLNLGGGGTAGLFIHFFSDAPTKVRYTVTDVGGSEIILNFDGEYDFYASDTDIAFVKDGLKVTCYVNGKAYSTPLYIKEGFSGAYRDTLNIGCSGGANRELGGHIKDFRIWHQALTAEQIKAIGGR